MSSIPRPQRWDRPFDENMSDDDVARLLAFPAFADIDAARFPDQIPLEGIVHNDSRLLHFAPGEVVVREGDYGNSAFLVLEGTVSVVLAPGLPASMLGRSSSRKRGFASAFSQLWRNRNDVPEVRVYERRSQAAASSQAAGVTMVDIAAVKQGNSTVQLGSGRIFGEIAALARGPRTATVIADSNSVLLEIRWQGLRELRRFDAGWRERIDRTYRANALKVHLGEDPLFAGLPPEALEKVAAATLFETYGSLDWNVQFKRKSGSESRDVPPIVAEGDYPDGLLMIRGGFARVTRHIGNGERSLTYLSAGSSFGLDELYRMWRGEPGISLRASIAPLGYVDVLRVPYFILVEHVFPNLTQPPQDNLHEAYERPLTDDSLMEWAIDERFINGTRTMMIDLDRCVRCDDCVRACASTHGGNPRFVRHGKQHDHWMVTNACMHCIDPVCMIGCPTGAIHRDQATGMVVINDESCIGCQTCANSCPYDNIRMVEIRNPLGDIIADSATGRPILKASKCDFCYEQPGGPACVRACPHDALSRNSFAELAKLAELR